MNLIAFSVIGSGLEDKLDPRFGRARHFLLYDLTSRHMRLIENEQNRLAAQGAGIHAAEIIVKSGADTLVTGHCGPKAFKVLNAAGVTVYNCSAQTIQEALEAVQSGALQAAGAVDVEDRW